MPQLSEIRKRSASKYDLDLRSGGARKDLALVVHLPDPIFDQGTGELPVSCHPSICGLTCPMMIQEQIDEDIKEAMRAKQADRLSVLRMAKSALMNAVIAKYGAGNKLADPEAIAVIQKQVKQRQDSIESFQKGGRDDLAEKEQKEIGILSTYLPKALSESELNSLVQESIAEAGATSKSQLGQVMKIATGKAAGRVDGKTLSLAVQKALS